MLTLTAQQIRRPLAAFAAAAAMALLAGFGPAAAQARSSAGFAASARAVSGGSWGTAVEVPGPAALNQGGSAWIGAVSCVSPGNCAAGGGYTDGSGHSQAFVVSQVGGTWGKAKEVPDTAAFNQGGNAAVNSVSCASAGNCSAGGRYLGSRGRQQAFVVSET